MIDIICIHQFCKHAQKMDCISNTQFCLKYVIPIAKKKPNGLSKSMGLSQLTCIKTILFDSLNDVEVSYWWKFNGFLDQWHWKYEAMPQLK